MAGDLGGPWVTIEDKVAGTRTVAGVCLMQVVLFRFSPLAFQASLQTSISKARNRTTGADMSIIEKKDKESHLSQRHRRDIFLCEPLSQPDATGYSVVLPDAAGTNPPRFADDYAAEITIAALPAKASANRADPADPQARSKSESAQR